MVRIKFQEKVKNNSELEKKILKIKSRNHFNAHIYGPFLEWYYKKFKGCDNTKEVMED